MRCAVNRILAKILFSAKLKTGSRLDPCLENRFSDPAEPTPKQLGMSQERNESLPLVREIFRSYLKEKSQRQTPERMRILEEIYSSQGHFDADDIYDRIRKDGPKVSRATVYNTLDLLMECGLVQKHQFGHNHAYYERSYAYQQHDHLICQECGVVIEFCDPRILEIQRMLESIHGFEITDHSLHFKGVCQDRAACRNRRGQDGADAVSARAVGRPVPVKDPSWK